MKSVAISLLVIALSLSTAVNGNVLEAQELKGSALDNEFLRSEAGHDFANHLPPVEQEKSCSKPKVICHMEPVVKMVLNKICAAKCKIACGIKWFKNPVQLKICVDKCDPQCMEKIVEYVKVCVPVNYSESSSYSSPMCHGKGNASASGCASSNGEVTSTATASGMNIKSKQLPIVFGSKGNCSSSSSGPIQLEVKWDKKNCGCPK